MMSWRNLRRLLCLTLSTVLLCCACGEQELSSDGSGYNQMDPTHTPYIGMVLKSTDNPYFALIKAGAEYEADKLGVQVAIVSPEKESNVKEQAQLVAAMTKLKTDVIIVAPSNEQRITQELENAKKSGKLVLTVDTSSDFADCDGYIGTDQYLAAYKQGAYAAKLVKEQNNANAVILRGADGDKTHMLREYGIEDGLKDGHVTVSAVEYCGCSEDKAEETMEALLKEDDNIQVRVGEIDAVFAQDPYEMGKQCIDYAVKKCNGEEVEDSVYTDVTLITSGNAEAHISELQRQLERWGGK